MTSRDYFTVTCFNDHCCSAVALTNVLGIFSQYFAYFSQFRKIKDHMKKIHNPTTDKPRDNWAEDTKYRNCDFIVERL